MFYDDSYVEYLIVGWIVLPIKEWLVYIISACVLTTLGKMGYTENGYGYRFTRHL